MSNLTVGETHAQRQRCGRHARSTGNPVVAGNGAVQARINLRFQPFEKKTLNTTFGSRGETKKILPPRREKNYWPGKNTRRQTAARSRSRPLAVVPLAFASPPHNEGWQT